MAFAISSARSNATAAATAANDSWKAQGFINLYLPTKSGGRRKLGSIPLKESRPSEAAILEMLAADPAQVTRILEKLELDFQLAEGNEDSAFDL